MPPLLQDYALFVEEFKETGGIWVMKPSGAAEGRGIFLFTKLSAVQAWAKPHLARRMKRSVTRYPHNPAVWDGAVSVVGQAFTGCFADALTIVRLPDHAWSFILQDANGDVSTNRYLLVYLTCSLAVVVPS